MSAAPNLNEEFYRWLEKWIESEIAVVYSPSNRYSLQSRIEELIFKKRVESLADLQTRIISGSDRALKETVLEIATNHETLFNRDLRFFNAIKEHLFPIWQNKTSLRVWSAASSTGQEIYSLMMMLERAGLYNKISHIDLVATDYSIEAVTKARAGTYTEYEMSRGLSPEDKSYFFTQDELKKTFTLKEEYRRRVKFDTYNLIKPHTNLGQFDFVMCRNVLIYFSIETRKKILNDIFACQPKDAYLALGAGETLLGISDQWMTQLLSGIPFFVKPK